MDAELRTYLERIDSRLDETRGHFEEVTGRLDARAEETRAHFEAVTQHLDARAEETRAHFEAVTQHLDARAEETRRHFDVVAEQMRSQIQLLAESVSSRMDRLEQNFCEEIHGVQKELSGMIRLSYRELDRKIHALTRARKR